MLEWFFIRESCRLISKFSNKSLVSNWSREKVAVKREPKLENPIK